MSESKTPLTDRYDPRVQRNRSKDDALTEAFGIVTISGPDYERLLNCARRLELALADAQYALVAADVLIRDGGTIPIKGVTWKLVRAALSRISELRNGK